MNCDAPPLASLLRRSLREDFFRMSLRGASGGEQFRSALGNTRGEIPRFARNDSPGLFELLVLFLGLF